MITEENTLNGDNYFDRKGYISASLLKELSYSPRNAKGLLLNEKKESKALNFGSLVDCLLTTPERFQTDYIIYEGTAPTDKLLLLAKDYINKYIQISESGEIPDETNLILSARAEVGYDSRLKEDTVISKFKNECADYCNFCITYKDKIIIDRETYEKASALNLETRNSRFLQNIFNPEPNTEVLFQVPIYIETVNFTGKALIDCIVVDHNNKTITPYDFKTYEDNFVSNYWKYGYYYQESWYLFLLNSINNQEWEVNSEIPEQLKVLYTGEYKINPFHFIAIDKSSFRNVIIYKTYDTIYQDIFFEGIINKGVTNIVKVKPIAELITELKFRVANDNWEDDYDMAVNGVKSMWL